MLDCLPQDVEYVGCDVSPRYINHAVRTYGHRGEFICKGVRELPEFGKFDIVLATAVLHHLNDQEADLLFKTSARQLKPGGYLVTLDNAYVNGQSRIARWLISLDRGIHTRTPGGYQDLARPYFSMVEGAIRHDLLRVPYTHFIMQCSNL